MISLTVSVLCLVLGHYVGYKQGFRSGVRRGIVAARQMKGTKWGRKNLWRKL